MEITEPTAIKGYEILERIGTGGFGAVYKALQSTIDREVAIKIILPGFANHPEFIRRFETEANVIARLEHPFIVPLYDYWRDPEGAYLVMRWLRGGSLRDKLRADGALSPAQTGRLFEQITGGLALAHRYEVIHRDIKPGNILLDEDGNAYLADFGIAKDLTDRNDGQTAADEIVGSLDYISPEQARSEPVTTRTDIYSLGVMLYEILTGQHPFHDFSAVERLYKHINDPLPEITMLEVHIRDAVNTVIQKATAKDPDKRYEDVLAFYEAFREAINAPEDLASHLTQREHDVLVRIVDGLTNKQIASELFIQVATVKTYITQIYRKLGVRSRVQATIRAHELGILDAGVGQATVEVVSISRMPEPENPYKGLRSFVAADHRDFFGREKMVDKLIEKMRETANEHRFLAVIGPSGSGKSSLVRAGLVPAIWNGRLPGSDRWFVADMLPGAHPMDELEVALTRIATKPVNNLNEHLWRDQRGLIRASQLILPEDDTEIFLIIDQFEEVFTLVKDEAERQHFLEILLTAVMDRRSRMRVVITLRADFYDRPLHYPEFGDLIRSRMETILPLSAKGLERAIVGPAERVHVTFEEGLVAQMVAEMNYQTSALPLLQYALTELFEHRAGRVITHEAYHAIGGAVGALAKRADTLFNELEEAHQEVTRQMFLRLVTLGEGTGDTRRRVQRAELLAISDSAEIMDEVIDLFAEYRLLSLDHEPATRTPTVEVAHEAILSQWERLREWINASRAEIKMQQQLSRMAEEWINAGKDSSYLARDNRLEQILEWQAHTRLALTSRERKFIDASQHHQGERAIAEHARKEKELQMSRRAQNFQRASLILGVMVVLAVIGIGASAFAFIGATNQMATATVVQGAALQQLEAVSTEVAIADQAVDSQRLALRGQDLFNAGDQLLGLSLVYAANDIPEPPVGAQKILADVAYEPGLRYELDDVIYVSSMALSPDNRYLLVGSLLDLTLWDTESGELVYELDRHQNTITEVVFSPDGSHFAVGSGGKVYLWNMASGARIWMNDQPVGGVYKIVFSPDGSRIAAGAAGNMTLLDTQTGESIWFFNEYPNVDEVMADDGAFNSINAVVFNSNGNRLYASGRYGINVFDVNTGERLKTIPMVDQVIRLFISEDDSILMSASGDSTKIDVIDAGTGELVKQHDVPLNIFRITAFSPDGTLGMGRGLDASSAVIWDIERDEIRLVIESDVTDILVENQFFSDDGHRIVSTVNNTEIMIWDIDRADVVHLLEGHMSRVYSAALSPDGTQALSASADDTVMLWDVVSGEAIRTFVGHEDRVWSVAYSPDGMRALSGSSDETVILWDVASGAMLRQFTGHAGNVRGLAFSPDGTQALSASDDQTVILWDVGTGEIVRRYEGHQDAVMSVAFSPDGTRALSGSEDQTVILWDVETGEIVRRYEGHQGTVMSVAFSPDGTQALSGSEDDTMILWDLESGDHIRHYQAHLAGVLSVAFSPDGTRALSGSEDQTIILWDVADGEVLRQYKGHSERVYSVAFSPDGTQALSASQDATLKVWRIDDLQSLLEWTASNRVMAELDCEQRLIYGLSDAGQCEATVLAPAATPSP